MLHLGGRFIWKLAKKKILAMNFQKFLIHSLIFGSVAASCMVTQFLFENEVIRNKKRLELIMSYLNKLNRFVKINWNVRILIFKSQKRLKERLISLATVQGECFSLKGVTGMVVELNMHCGQFFYDSWDIKRFYDLYLLSLSAKSTFKIIYLGGYVFRIIF